MSYVEESTVIDETIYDLINEALTMRENTRMLNIEIPYSPNTMTIL